MRRGLTLPEVLVAVVLSAVVGGVLFQMLSQASRAFQIGWYRSELQVGGSLALGRLVRDLENTGLAGVSVGEESLVTTPLRGITADGRPTWEESAVVCWRADGKLLRHVCTEPPAALEFDPSQPLQLQPHQVELLFTPQAGVLARGVQTFTVRREERLVHLQLLLTSGSQTLEFRRDVFLRNP